ncbi:MAG: phenylalanine--tRNA ligase subunit alpha [Nitrososphaeria archaeon]
MRRYRRVAIGGTFDPFHRGHRALIDAAFSLGDEVVIGVSSDELARRMGKAPDRTFGERACELLEYLESKYRDRVYSLHKLDDPFGPLASDPSIEALVVSPETEGRGRAANEVRRSRGLREVDIIRMDFVLAEDGEPISSTRIRRGEIDKEGRILEGAERGMGLGADSLHPLERRVLAALRGSGGPLDVDGIAAASGLSPDQVRRAVEWLRSKGMVRVEWEVRRVAVPGPGARRILEEGLPEDRLLRELESSGGELGIPELAGRLRMDSQELSASLGRLSRGGYVSISRGRVRALRGGPYSRISLDLLRRLVDAGELPLDGLSPSEASALDELSRRPGVIEVREVRRALVSLAEGAPALQPAAGSAEEVTQLTPEDISTGRWRSLRLSRLDVVSPVPEMHPGRRHVITEYVRRVREIFASMGFQEVSGGLLQISFWNFDALYTPQDHPARELQDTFYMDVEPTEEPPADVESAVAATHENGWRTGSTGWGYEWDPREARRVVLRTHTTVLSVRALHATRDLPVVKLFSVGEVFRNEKVDSRHLVEFHQIEGIVKSPDANLRRLMGYISEFYSRLGFRDVKFWPTYFPYTEPSLQVMVRVGGSWLEMGGMGIFRPEVTLPLGVEEPVLAWGLGLERLIMVDMGIEDARELYANRLSWLRRVPACRSWTWT